jgi:hypothetical protein
MGLFFFLAAGRNFCPKIVNRYYVGTAIRIRSERQTQSLALLSRYGIFINEVLGIRALALKELNLSHTLSGTLLSTNLI